MPLHFDVLLFQGFESVSFTNSPTDSIYDRWTGHEDAGSNSPGRILVSCWLDFFCLPEFGETDFTYRPRANIWSPHLRYVPHWALGLHDSSWYVLCGFIVFFPVALKWVSLEALPNPFTKPKGILPNRVLINQYYEKDINDM